MMYDYYHTFLCRLHIAEQFIGISHLSPGSKCAQGLLRISL